MKFPDKWYIKGSQELEEWSKQELSWVNVVFYRNQCFYAPDETFKEWEWVEEDRPQKLRGYIQLTFEQFVECYENLKNPFPVSKSIDGDYLKPLLKKLGI